MREQQDWQRGQLYLRDVQTRQAARAAAGTELPAGVSLDVAIAREKLEEISAGKLGKLKPGHFGRDQQWSDPEFPAIRKSLGNCAGARLVKKWKEARAINIDSDLFKGGTDPDDVHQVGHVLLLLLLLRFAPPPPRPHTHAFCFVIKMFLLFTFPPYCCCCCCCCQYFRVFCTMAGC
jgi:hypothetical protein